MSGCSSALKAKGGRQRGSLGACVHRIGHTESITACARFKMFLFLSCLLIFFWQLNIWRNSRKFESDCKFSSLRVNKSWMSDAVKSWTNDTHMSYPLFVQALVHCPFNEREESWADNLFTKSRFGMKLQNSDLYPLRMAFMRNEPLWKFLRQAQRDLISAWTERWLGKWPDTDNPAGCEAWQVLRSPLSRRAVSRREGLEGLGWSRRGKPPLFILPPSPPSH